MRKFQSHTLGIEQGSIVLFSDYQHDGVMWTGKGAREFRHVVSFDNPFSTPPMVQVGVSMFDFDRDTNQRADISAELITREGFAIVFRTWGDTRVARIRADWIAFGDVPNEDDWDVD
ncbi:H-type lectin domain-containing protein [Pseudoruegeria sp. SHC-113]|uniref:H-type lectin domain-containing protein n=1 Tax=Pseudoruegeria sp. SHC-113 TaxID=2855439 RepID=UPI0021BA6D94|nr:H-type lectin domain-containing protein [Pseudoruegeria sp. SHC-113]MCT8159619.1 H-type lectin domain-containing protein [Pseudoruegeria sp. SHC-113]